MLNKSSISEIMDWSHVDYVCIKAKSGILFEDIYYLDGHPMFESSLTDFDMNFINFTHDNCPPYLLKIHKDFSR